jgi:hypothetical protein
MNERIITMKREKILSVMLTVEELRELRKKMRETEDKEGKTYTQSSYVRSKLIQPHINGNKPDTIQENVSIQELDTDSEHNPDTPTPSIQENVSIQELDTDIIASKPKNKPFSLDKDEWGFEL